MRQTLLTFLDLNETSSPTEASGDGIIPAQSNNFHQFLDALEAGDTYFFLSNPFTRRLLGTHDSHDDVQNNLTDSSNGYFTSRLDRDFREQDVGFREARYILLGLAALQAFVQANVTGPPLGFKSDELLFPTPLKDNQARFSYVRRGLFEELSVDGLSVYQLTPDVGLFSLAKSILNDPRVIGRISGSQWARLRVNFLHQRLLAEDSDTLQSLIYEDLGTVDKLLFTPLDGVDRKEHQVPFLLERAAIHTYYGYDSKARMDLELATKMTGFAFALTGKLGKRTKFQDSDLSQLVVLARSATSSVEKQPSAIAIQDNEGPPGPRNVSKPRTLDLNDDTLLESISFTKEKKSSQPSFEEEFSLPRSLTSLDPSSQPALQPLDSIILLSWASSITNTSPQDGLTREETLPYATRVLDEGSSNWQIYTQALLVRSRIEGYRSRTIERSVLQLQALVDQMITETMGPHPENESVDSTQRSTFLPRLKESESAPVSERLKFVWQLNSPTRWEIEAELAARWVTLGGLRTALDIYERLEMWAEAALCWAATDREDKARVVLRSQLFLSAEGKESAEKTLLPADAPRLFCILGDIDKDPAFYVRAWEISNRHYARAQRSLGRFYVQQKEYRKAATAYDLSLHINRLNHSTWFALGCVYLELEAWQEAFEAFTRTVQLDDTDAEAWSNLAAALLQLPPSEPQTSQSKPELHLDDEEVSPQMFSSDEAQKHKRDALSALTRAARLKPTDARIHDNLLTVSLQISPPPYSQILQSMSRIVALRGPKNGESAVPVSILRALISRVIEMDSPTSNLARNLVRLVDESIVPLITHSSVLWREVAKLALWRKKNASAMDAYEKAWRATLSGNSGWENGAEEQWEAIVDATIELVDGYESLGPRDKGEGLGPDELVAKDWRFKARSAIRGVMGKGKSSWEDTKGWERLKERMIELR